MKTWDKYVSTLGNMEWVIENQSKLKELFPSEWGAINPLKIGFGLKLLGLNWKDLPELAWLMAMFEKMEIIEREDAQIRANTRDVLEVFKERQEWPEILV